MGIITKHPFDLKDKTGWLKLRDSLIAEGRLGGSDLGTAVGDNQYKSPYALWCERIGIYEPEDISDREAIKQGIMFEPAVAERFAKETGIAVEEAPYILTNSDAPHLLATPDRLSCDGESGLECKTAKEVVMKKFPKGDFPQQYFDQCACYLKVTERKRWYIAILVYGTAFNIYLMTTIKEEADRFAYLKQKVDALDILTPEESEEWQKKWNYLLGVYYIDQESLDSCEAAAANFNERVQAGKRGDMSVWPTDEIDGSVSTTTVVKSVTATPTPESSVTFDNAEIYGVQGDGEVYTGAKGDEVVALFNKKVELAAQIEQAKEALEEVDNQLKTLMKSNEEFILPVGKITYKITKGREYGNVAPIKKYFEALGKPVPDGFITKCADSRGLRLYPKKIKNR